MSASLENQIIAEIAKLRDDQQQKVLHFARALTSTPSGTPGKDLLTFAGAIGADDLGTMAREIEEACEHVNINEW